jgi:hypothetical protein
MDLKNKLLIYILIDILSILTLFFVVYFWKYNLLLTALLFLIGIVMLFILKSLKKIIIFISCGVMGAIAEIIAIGSGAWFYSNSDFLGIPYWLIPLWGIAALFMINFQEQLLELKNIFKKLKKN